MANLKVFFVALFLTLSTLIIALPSDGDLTKRAHFELSCSLGQPAEWCRLHYGTFCDGRGHMNNEAPLSEMNGDCSYQWHHCSCDRIDPPPTFNGEICHHCLAVDHDGSHEKESNTAAGAIFVSTTSVIVNQVVSTYVETQSGEEIATYTTTAVSYQTTVVPNQNPGDPSVFIPTSILQSFLSEFGQATRTITQGNGPLPTLPGVITFDTRSPLTVGTGSSTAAETSTVNADESTSTITSTTSVFATASKNGTLSATATITQSTETSKAAAPSLAVGVGGVMGAAVGLLALM